MSSRKELILEGVVTTLNPGHEEDSWQRLHEEALDRFFAGTYGGDYEAARIAEFEKLLPETPPWKQ